MPDPDPLRAVDPPQGFVSVAEHGSGIVQQHTGGVPEALPTQSEKEAVADEVLSVPTWVPVHLAVVFGQPSGSKDAEVGPCADDSISVAHVVLRLHGNVTDEEQQAQHRLPRRLRPRVHVGECAAQGRRAASALCRRLAQVVERAVSKAQRSVGEDDEVEQAEVTSGGQQDLRWRGDPQPATGSQSIRWVCRQTTSPGRRGRGSESMIPANTGSSAGKGGSHQPRTMAPVRWVKVPEFGSTCCQDARSARRSPASPRGRCTP